MSLQIKKLAKWLSILALAALTTACAGPRRALPGPAPGKETGSFAASAKTDENPGLAALAVAREMLGVSYRYGGSDPRGFDCSGLIHYAFRQAGVQLPRTSRDIFRNCELIGPENLKPGDLVFFAISAKKVSHVGIYAGRQRFIHSPSSGKGVSYASLNEPYWRERLVGIGRF